MHTYIHTYIHTVRTYLLTYIYIYIYVHNTTTAQHTYTYATQHTTSTATATTRTKNKNKVQTTTAALFNTHLLTLPLTPPRNTDCIPAVVFGPPSKTFGKSLQTDTYETNIPSNLQPYPCLVPLKFQSCNM